MENAQFFKQVQLAQASLVLKQNPPLKRAQNNLDISLGSRLTPASPRILNPIPKLTHCKVCKKLT
jgi:hypothetical protein